VNTAQDHHKANQEEPAHIVLLEWKIRFGGVDEIYVIHDGLNVLISGSPFFWPSPPSLTTVIVAVLATALAAAKRHIMSSHFSVTGDASLFGLDVELNVYLSRLEAAKVFCQIRKDIDRNITALKTLTPNAFGKRRTKDTFKENVELVVNGAPESRVLMPLVEQLGSDDSVINILLLACFTLSKTTCTQLEKHNLTEVFAEFLTCIVDDCTIFPSMRAKFIDIIKEVCRKNHNETSNKLLGWFLVSADTMHYKLTCLGALGAEGGREKRRRLDLRPQHIRAEQNEAESLMFDPEVLSPLEAEVQTALSSVPPNHGQRRKILTFVLRILLTCPSRHRLPVHGGPGRACGRGPQRIPLAPSDQG
jgi:hypothetical protein